MILGDGGSMETQITNYQMKWRNENLIFTFPDQALEWYPPFSRLIYY